MVGYPTITKLSSIAYKDHFSLIILIHHIFKGALVHHNYFLTHFIAKDISFIINHFLNIIMAKDIPKNWSQDTSMRFLWESILFMFLKPTNPIPIHSILPHTQTHS